ncbi:MAG: polysaccharide pyruvyl transferase family protein [Candidatus Bathyarchaeota archaeon]|nr:polysaccharide pyruvyl transferase family protein [Candidatus Bathyarchaeota archaeon]
MVFKEDTNSSTKPKRIFVDGASFTHRSLGTREMGIGAFMLLKKYAPDAKLCIVSAHPKEEHEQCRKLNFDVKITKQKQSFFAAIPVLLSEYFKADLIVGVYGDGFTGRNQLQNSVLLSKFYLDFIVKLLLIDATGKPLLIFPSSLGPFNRSFDRFFVKNLLNRARAVMVREPLSKKYLLAAGINKNIIFDVPDVAFIVQEASPKSIEYFSKLKSKSLIVGIGASQLISSESEKYTEILAKTADYLVTNLHATVLLIPHEIQLKKISDPPSHSAKIGGDDLDAVRKVYSQVTKKQNIIPVTDESEADILKAIIGQCDLFIGSRTHSIIAALSMGVPTIGIAYSQKTPGIMRMVGLDEFVSHFRTLTCEDLILKINTMISARVEIQNKLSIKAEELKKQVWGICDVIDNF